MEASQVDGNGFAKAKRPRTRTKHAAIYTGSSESTLEKLRVTGGGPAYIKIGKVVVYDLDDLDEWLAKHRRISTAA